MRSSKLLWSFFILTIFALFYYVLGSDPQQTLTEPKKSEAVIENMRPFMPLTGTRWVYEGKRIFYDKDSQGTKEIAAMKIVEVTSVTSEGDNVRATYKETYTNDPDFTEREGSFLFSENGFSFDGETVAMFPLEKGQRLSYDAPERDDGFYDYYVTYVLEQVLFGKNTTCYEITYRTMADVENKIFCEGVGYVRDRYKHSGTPNEADYHLIDIPKPNKSI
jgi:hypothetical protein